MLRSHHRRSRKRGSVSRGVVIAGCIIVRTSSPDPVPRQQSQFGSKSYRDALQRAFNKAKEQIYFNTDMQYFVTLTYAGIEDDYTQVMHDVKMLVKAEKRNGNNLKYIYVFEWQKRGSLHVHMITNAALTTYKNKNNYDSLKYWKHGYTSMLTIQDFDDNFRPHLYLFKYMRKAERIGKSFVHSSRNLKNYSKLDNGHINLIQWRTVTQEYTETTVLNTNFAYIRNYLQYDDTLLSDVKTTALNNLNEKDILLWQEKVKSHSMKVSAKLAVNHTLPSNLRWAIGKNFISLSHNSK